ncbi:PH domain-containing protein [Arthrobacter echini]|uniref:PH domain-containing protein n=1 Tax=Arthrobacter echini TaxID=1529066 RepID=A0A4S5E8A3_9MICC|nr:PH domain-containing protein [Arthrobacter echini]THJ67814.1 PH domain-containing protein [Arthrobacter echini]
MRVKLLPGERVIVRTRPSPLPLVRPVLGGFVVLAAGGFCLGYLGRGSLAQLGEWQPVVLLLAFAVVVLLLLVVVIRPLIRWSSTRYVLTSRRLIHRRGVSRRIEQDIPLSSGLQIHTEQRLLQRMTGSGTLLIGPYYDRAYPYRDVPQIATFKEYLGLAISELPSTRILDGVDMDSGGHYYRGGTREDRNGWRPDQS